MSYTRTLTADLGGAFPLSIETNSVQFKMFAEDRRDVLVELTTEDGQDSEVGRAIDNAWGELERNRYKLFVANPTTVVYGNGSVSFASRGIVAVVRFPRHSPVEVDTKSGSFDIEGEIGHLEVESGSGSVGVSEAASAKVRMSSGTFGANAIYGRTDLRASSGNLTVAYLNGDFVITASSGNVRIGQIHAAGEIEVSSGNISVRGFDGRYLDLLASSGNIEHPEGDDRIKARVSSGYINGRSPRRNRW